jgi:hypothetical protein
VTFNKEGSRGIFEDGQALHPTMKSTRSLVPIPCQDERPRMIIEDDKITLLTGYKETNSKESRIC